MRSKHPFSRWISLECAERYLNRFGGFIFHDRANGYTVLFDDYRNTVAFVKR